MSGKNLKDGSNVFKKSISKKSNAVAAPAKNKDDLTPEKQQALSRQERLAKRQKLSDEHQEKLEDLKTPPTSESELSL